jgi:hypothetical protein
MLANVLRARAGKPVGRIRLLMAAGVAEVEEKQRLSGS